MVCSAQGFPRLQELRLSFLSVEEWRMEVEAMPRLSRLMIFYFFNMKKLPEGLLHLPFLKELELWVVYPDSEEDVTRKKLQGRGCKVGHLFSSPLALVTFVLWSIFNELAVDKIMPCF